MIARLCARRRPTVIGRVAPVLLAGLLLALARVAAAQPGSEVPAPPPADPGAFDRAVPEAATWDYDDPEPMPLSVFGRVDRSGRGHWPRTVYAKPPFDGGDYWRPGGVFRVPEPRLFLLPTRFLFLYDLSGVPGWTADVRILGNGLMSWGMGFTTFDSDKFRTYTETADDGTLQTVTRQGSIWRLQTDLSVLNWISPQSSIEVGGLIGIEEDSLYALPVDNDVGFYFGAIGRFRLWRALVTAEWMMRLDQEHDLNAADVRHAFRVTGTLELLRIDMLSLEIGGWWEALTKGAPRGGVSIGLRVWFSFDREAPDYASRYGTLPALDE